nr:hypothetical protein [uncultured Methanobrevibacter sp.]
MKKKNNVFIIYAERRDTVFKICSHYDEELPHKKCKKIKKGDKFHSVLLSQFREIETKWGIMPNLGVGIVYFGVYVTRRDNKWDDKYFKGKIGDVHISYDLNGLYPKSCYHN